MNTHTITTTIGAQWFRRGIVVLGTLLIAGTIASGLARRPLPATRPPASTSAPASAARTRYDTFKLQQVEQVEAIPHSGIALTLAQAR